MAKAKPGKEDETPKKSTAKAEAKPKDEAKPKAAAKKSSAPAAAPKPKKAAKPSASSTDVPLIDTGLAAQAAAKMVVNRDLLSKPAAEKKESGSFKQLKESLLKPAVQGPGGLLSPQGQQKKFNTGFGGRNQVSHNQTFGADVNRSGVPRRTSGG
jgi:hypothetical protein